MSLASYSNDNGSTYADSVYNLNPGGAEQPQAPYSDGYPEASLQPVRRNTKKYEIYKSPKSRQH